MINLDLSNVWGELSLPDLLAAEQEVSSAHQTLASGKGEGGDFTGWLDLPTVDETEEVQRIRTAAQRIRESSDVLVVVGIGGSYLGPRAGIELLCGQHHNLQGQTQVLFAGNTLSTRAWQEFTYRPGEHAVQQPEQAASGAQTAQNGTDKLQVSR